MQLDIFPLILDPAFEFLNMKAHKISPADSVIISFLENFKFIISCSFKLGMHQIMILVKYQILNIQSTDELNAKYLTR